MASYVGSGKITYIIRHNLLGPNLFLGEMMIMRDQKNHSYTKSRTGL